MAWKTDKILVPTDSSECARSVLTQAVTLARSHGAELHFLHVMISHDEDPYGLVYQVSDGSDVYRQQRKLCASVLRQKFVGKSAPGFRGFRSRSWSS